MVNRMSSIPKGWLGFVIIGLNGESITMVFAFLFTDHKKSIKIYRRVAY
jgi:hypothetical protein